MTAALTEWASVVDAIATGRQIVHLWRRPHDVDAFCPVPVPGPDDDPDPERDVPVRTWCKVVGVLPLDDDRLEAAAEAVVVDPDVVASWGGGLRLAFVDPHRLVDPVRIEVAADVEREMEMEIDVDVTRAQPVLETDRLRDRHNLLKTALGVMV